MAEFVAISKLALHDQVRARLRAMLIEARIPPGAKLNERELSEQLCVSRTPLREAIKLLATEGLVDLLPNRGAVAVKLSQADVLHTFEVLGGLEAMSGELAAQRITDDELTEIRALHYDMMACFTRQDLPLLQPERTHPRRHQRRRQEPGAGERLPVHQCAGAIPALSHQPERRQVEASREGA